LNSALPPLVRVHVKDTLRDVVGVINEKLGWPLRAAMQRVAKEESGVVVILRPEESPRILWIVCDCWTPSRPASKGEPWCEPTHRRPDTQGSWVEAHARVERQKTAAGTGRFDLEITSYVDGDD